MSLKISTATANGLANSVGIKEQFDGGFLYLFAGPVPASADEALDLVTLHSGVAKFTESDDGTTGLTFDAPVDGFIGKATAEAWEATIDITGFHGSDTTIEPTFFRYCMGADDGSGAANTTTGYRLQGTVGSINGGFDLGCNPTTFTDGTTREIGAFGIAVGDTGA